VDVRAWRFSGAGGDVMCEREDDVDLRLSVDGAEVVKGGRRFIGRARVSLIIGSGL
jgi:hypothetical protein